MSDVLSWDEIRDIAANLEISSEEKGGGVKLSKYEGVRGWFADSEAGRIAAHEWLHNYREVVAVKDRYAGQEEPRKRWLDWLKFGHGTETVTRPRKATKRAASPFVEAAQKKTTTRKRGTPMQLLQIVQISYALLYAVVVAMLVIEHRNRLAVAYAVGDVVRCRRNGQRYTGAITELLEPTPAGQPRFAVIAVTAPVQPRAVLVRYRSIRRAV